MASVNWTDPALHALDGIYDYLHREAPFYAERDDIREVICKGYRVIYLVVTDDRIDILGVIHGSRDLMNADNQPWERN